MTTVNLVREVRERSNAPLGECKTALDEAGGDVDKALTILQKRGEAKAISAGGRIATEGVVHSYVHPGGRISVLVEVNCETDFVAMNPEFLAFCDNVAMQVAAMGPKYVDRASVPSEVSLAQESIFKAQLQSEGKPEKSWSKIIDGKINKWCSEVCLMDQALVTGSNPKNTVETERVALIAKLGENVKVRRFVRWELGEGLEKRSVDLAADVAKLTS